MDQDQIKSFILLNRENFNEESLPSIRTMLDKVPEEQFSTIQNMTFKSPTVGLILSLCLGSFGVDRFYIGDIGLGVVKLLTAGACGIWTIIDWFSIQRKVRDANLKKLSLAL